MNPMGQNPKNKQLMMVGGGILVVIVLLTGFFILRGKSQPKTVDSQNQDDVFQNSEAIPTVDASVIVDLKADKLKHEVALSISGIPEGTTTIDYEMSYLAEGDLPKGVIGTIDTVGKSSVEKKGITLGTCSSGACLYDKGVTSIKVSLKFNSSEGAKIFEKEFDI